MRTILRNLLLVVVATIAVVSCQKPEISPVLSDRGEVMVSFNAVAEEPSTKVSLGTSDDINFTTNWIKDTDKLWIEYNWTTDDDVTGEGSVLSNAWNGSCFTTSIVGPKNGENEDVEALWGYNCYYPQPTINGNYFFDFESTRTQDGPTYSGKYDLMIGGSDAYGFAGKDDEGEDIIFNMDRLTSIAYFRVKTSGFDASEKLSKAVLTIADGDIIASDKVYLGVDSENKPCIYPYGTGQSNSITLSTEQSMSDIKLWFNLIPVIFSQATLELVTTQGRTLTLTMGDGENSIFGYEKGQLYKAVIETIPASAFVASQEPEIEPVDFSKTYSYGLEGWSLTNYTDQSSYYQVPSGNDPSVATISGIFSGKTITSDVVVTINCATYGSGTNPSAKTFSLFAETACTNAITATQGGTLPTSSTYQNVTYTVKKANAASLKDDLAIKITKPGKTIRLKSIKVDFSCLVKPVNYNVYVANNIANGSVTANPTSAKEGTEITLTATPADGYELGSWDVTNASTSEKITVTDNKFTMPAANVNVGASFVVTPTYLTTIDQIFSAATTAGSTATDTYVTFNNWIVSGVKGNNAYVTDNAGKGFIIYQSGHGFEVGDVLSGSVACKVQLYNGSAELTSLTSNTTGLSVTKGGEVSPISTIALASLSGVNTGAVLSYEELEFDGTNFTDGQTSLKPYNALIALPTLISGKTYNVTGVYVQYRDIKEIAPRTENDFELIEVINSYVVTFATPENGTITVKNGDTIINEGDAVAEGTTLTVECTPASGYRFKNWQYKAGDAAWATRTTNPQDYTMPSSDVQFRANFEEIPVYTVAWSVNGRIVKSETLEAGTEVTAPEVSDTDGKVFCGWVTSAIDGTTNEEPEIITPSTTAIASVTYYALFATQTGGGASNTHNLTQDQIASAYVGSGDNKTTSYGNYEFGDGWSGSCLINKYNNISFVQIRKNTANNYIVSPIFGDGITFVTIETTAGGSTQSTAQNRTFYLCSNNETAQPTSGDYGSGALAENNGSVTISVSGNPNQIFIYSNGAAYIKSITVTYGGGMTRSEYCTTVTE